MDVTGKTVVVAGGAGSLGSAVAEDLRRRGARVAILDVKEPAAAQDADLPALLADAADERSTEAAFAKLQSIAGVPAAVVNCTGMIHSEPLLNVLDPQQRRHRTATWDSVLRANLTAAFVLGAVAADFMARSRVKGVIVNFSSIAAGGNPGQSAYAAAKAGVEALTAVWSRELGVLGIRVVTIAPGFVDTPSTRAALDDAALAEIARRTPLRRLARPQEIAAAVAFAIENDFLTGGTISVDGGLAI